MSLLRRLTETRTGTLDTLAELIRLRGVSSYAAGQPVTTATARRLTAVWRCQHLLADIVAGLPVDQYRRSDNVRVEMRPSEFVTNPSSFVDSYEWRYQLMLSALDRGNGYAYITEFDSAMRFARKAEVLDPFDVAVERRDGALASPVYRVAGQVVDPARILHFRAFGPAPGSVLGMSPIDYAAHTIGLGLASRQYGAGWYEKGGHPTAMLSADADITADEAKVAKQRFREATTDDQLLVLGKTWKYEALQVAPEKAAFLEAQNATAIDVCGIYGVPPELVGYASQGGSSVTYANREQRALDVLVFTVQWWLGRMERLLSSQIPSPQFVKINADALLRTDLLSRYQAHDLSIRGGWATPNERRLLEDMKPLDDRDDALWPPYTTTVGGEDSRSLSAAEVAQKVYLAVVNGVITPDEGREMINAAGGNLTIPGPVPDA